MNKLLSWPAVGYSSFLHRTLLLARCNVIAFIVLKFLSFLSLL